MQMNKELLRKHISDYLAKEKADPVKFETELKDRAARSAYYQFWTAEKLKQMNADELFEYLSKLWALQIWGNKHYAVNKLIEDNTLAGLLQSLSDLIWGTSSLQQRWDDFRKSVKGVGPAMMSELLCHVHPSECMLWNRRAYVAFNYLGVPNLPRYDYQFTGAKYVELCELVTEIAQEMESMGHANVDLLAVDYFIWDELQVADNLTDFHKPIAAPAPPAHVDTVDQATAVFIHDEVRDKIAQIGSWLGFHTNIEVKVAGGAVVDSVWEAAIGNMGRVIYVFEVQTKGSIDSLVLNLLKALNNPAVQGVVAVSDAAQMEKIKGEVAHVHGLKDKLKYWNYAEVLKVHEALQSVSEAINGLNLVPQGF